MPELPEVETVRRGIAGCVTGKPLIDVVVRNGSLRRPVPPELPERFAGALVEAVERRAKYLLFSTDRGWLIWHLGMSGSLRIVPADLDPEKHDHIDMIFADGICLRYNDPRRFGMLLWTPHEPEKHPLISHLGPEPLGKDFDGDYLWRRSRNRSMPVKSFIMDSRIVVGVGNIYASEALFQARIRPGLSAGSVSRARYSRLAAAIKDVLTKAIAAGGTTLRNFVNGEGRPGYFRIQLQVYGRAGKPCPACGKPLSVERIGQRSTFFCRHCQK